MARGSTVVLAAAMGDGGKVWSIDIGEKAERVLGEPGTALDDETRAFCGRLGSTWTSSLETAHAPVRTGEFDIVVIDGDHTYEGTRIDADRFGRKLPRRGRAAGGRRVRRLLRAGRKDTAGRVVSELRAEGDSRLVKPVDRLAHLERVR